MKKQCTNNSGDNGFKHNDSTKKMGHTGTESRQKLGKQAQCSSGSKSTTQCKGCSSTKNCHDKNCSQKKSGMAHSQNDLDNSKKGHNGSDRY